MMSEIFVIEAIVKPQKRKEVKDRVRACKCVKCKCDGIKKRGLCEQCYNAWYYVWSRLPSNAAKARYESQCINDGVLLRAYDKTTKAARNAFAAIARKVGAK